MNPLLNLKVGDSVVRYLSSARIPMPLKVTAVTDDKIVCGAWEFNKNTGGEIDEFFGWDGKGTTGSVIELPPENV